YVTGADNTVAQIRDGMRILVVSDLNPGVNNRIYTVSGIESDSKIVLTLDTNGISIYGDPQYGEIIRYNMSNGLWDEYWYNGETWIKTQIKEGVNSPPLFSLYDINKNK